MRKVLLALLSAVAIGGSLHPVESQEFVTLDPEPAYYAWWLRARFHPFETEVRGIPAQAIRNTWCKASEFRLDLFPKDLDFDDGLSFAIDGFFDGSKTRQTALVGAYETCDGGTGSFLLILDRPHKGPPAIRFVHEMKTDHQFEILRAGPDSSIMIWHCMSCDNGSQLKWNRSKRRFVWVESDD
jgi:hypothetical protein